MFSRHFFRLVIFIPDDKLADTPGSRLLRDHCQLLYRSLDPAWDRWDFPGWLKRFSNSSIYRCG
jgi:hypothetical protein